MAVSGAETICLAREEPKPEDYEYVLCQLLSYTAPGSTILEQQIRRTTS